jgi:hypothetical protein
MYVDDCPDCGCPMVADEPGLAGALLAARPPCADAGCACHSGDRQSAR